MSTTDNVLLIVLTSLLSILIFIGILVTIAILNVVVSVRRVMAKAENVVDSVESAAEVITDAKGRLAVLKLVNNIIKMTNKK
jgi:hypothetical protein